MSKLVSGRTRVETTERSGGRLRLYIQVEGR